MSMDNHIPDWRIKQRGWVIVIQALVEFGQQITSLSVKIIPESYRKGAKDEYDIAMWKEV